MQQSFQFGTGPVSIDQVLASLRRLRVQIVGMEYDLQADIAAQFDKDGVTYSKEHKLGPHNRVDFLIAGGIGVEVKKGKPNSRQVMAQVERYAQFPQITALVLVVERNVFQYDRSANGKPVYYISLAKQWGIAL